ncbi:MAG: hypothetical protein JWL61_2977 [Gemmatimonadetes bacterium]|nr:hypothetical protein [Gemmatimonadota bacterium]
MTLSRTIRALGLVAVSSLPALAQTPADGFMMPKRHASIGVLYAQDSWDHYWEGTLKRTNGNIGTVTTRSVTWHAGYGITERLGVMATLPYISTHASQGVLSDASGIQDLSIAAKYKLLTAGSTRGQAFSAFLVGAAALPMGDYTPDFMPLSIGTAGGRASARLTLNYQPASSWFANASSAYTFCSNVTLNRNSYFANGQLYLTNEVAMPNVLENTIGAGYQGGRWQVPLAIVQQRTLGGGDIRRQDMPFVSNRMDFVRVDGAVMYALPVPNNLSIRFGASHVLTGRNVGQSTTFTTGVSHAFRL